MHDIFTALYLLFRLLATLAFAGLVFWVVLDVLKMAQEIRDLQEGNNGHE